MNIYRTALSALLIAPIVGMVGVQMIHGYQNAKKQAECYVEETEYQMNQALALLGEDMSVEVPNDIIDQVENDIYNNSVNTGNLMNNMNLINNKELVENVGAKEDGPAYEDPEKLYDDVRDAVIRFHIRANSDMKEDQDLKLLVRDSVLAYLNPLLVEAENRDTAKVILEEHLPQIEAIGKAVVEAEGYEYEIHAYLTCEEFPLKSYGDLLFPAGEYEALRIDIGEYEGGNWWCVMYPGLCFVDTVGGVTAVDGKEELQNVLSEEEFQSLLLYPENCDETPLEIEFRSFFWDYFKGNI